MWPMNSADCAQFG